LTGALLVGAGMLLPGAGYNQGGKVALSDAKRLFRQWDKSSFRTLAASIRYHSAKHG